MLPEVNNKIKQELDDITPEDCIEDEKKRDHFQFTQLCEKQPIGKHMFGDFCKNAEKKIKDVYALTQAIRNYEAGRIKLVKLYTGFRRCCPRPLLLYLRSVLLWLKA